MHFTHLGSPAGIMSTVLSAMLICAHAEAASSELSSKVAVGWHPSSHDWNLQIEKDLHRTFPGHPVMDGTGRSALRRILAAYARRNPDVGYCQVLHQLYSNLDLSSQSLHLEPQRLG